MIGSDSGFESDAAFAAPSALRPIVTTGSSANRIDMVFLGDGYTASQIATSFTAGIQSYLSYIFGDSSLTQPFGRYQNFFDIWAVDVISNQSGADDPSAGILRDTALDATYRFDGSTQRLLYINNGKADAVLSAALSGAGLSAEMKFVLVNDTQYGGGGGAYAVYAAGNASARDVALHEVGHSFAGLADEYGGDTRMYAGGEPSEIDVTKDSSGAKWAEWLGYNDPVLGTVGAYEGGRYFDQGIYRPTIDSKMRDLGQPFDPIAREQFIHTFYQFVDPLDSYDSNVGTKVNVQTLSVAVIDPAVILVDWIVNNQVFANAGQQFSLTAHGFDSGSFTVTARAYDPTDWVRGDRSDLEQSVTWNVVQNFESAIGAAHTVDSNVKADVLWFNSTSNGMDWWTMNDGRWASGINIATHPAGYTIAGSGDFNRDGSNDVIWLNPTTMDTDIWLLNQGHWVASVDVGSHPSDYQIAATGDFNRDGASDILWINPATKDAEVWTLNNGHWVGSIDIGVHPGNYQFAGAGDFNHDGISDVLWVDPQTNDAEIWLVSNGHWSASIDIGSHPVGYRVAATGDFNHDGTSDVVWFNAQTNDAEVWLLNNGHWQASVDVGSHPAGYEVTRASDFDGDGTDDILWFNPATRDTEVWLLSNGHWAGTLATGSHPAGWVAV